MKLVNILFAGIYIGLLTLGFVKPKCEHIYVATVQPEIKIEHTQFSSCLSVYTRPSGKQEGQEVVCVKCFDLRKQILDYGEAKSSYPAMPSWGRLLPDPLIERVPNHTEPDTCYHSYGYKWDVLKGWLLRLSDSTKIDSSFSK